jgi:hypothetical protein
MSQEALGRELGFGDKWKTYQAYESGRAPMPQEVKDRLVGLGFDGQFPEPGQEVTRADLDILQKNILTHQGWMAEEAKKRDMALAASLQEILKRLGAGKEK